MKAMSIVPPEKALYAERLRDLQVDHQLEGPETVHGAHPLPVPEVCPVTLEDLLGEDLGIEITDEDRKPKPSTKP